ncbi:MAG: SHOCT domain-containing protein [Halobacteriota archaeon]
MQQPQPVDVVGQIERLEKLKDQGFLTEQEFQAKKQDLLARMRLL